jgi:hypothetical protein
MPLRRITGLFMLRRPLSELWFVGLFMIKELIP